MAKKTAAKLLADYRAVVVMVAARVDHVVFPAEIDVIAAKAVKKFGAKWELQSLLRWSEKQIDKVVSR